MPVPPKPNPPVLFGATPAQRETSRRADALRFSWTDVPTAETYDIRFGNSDVRTNVARGTFLGGLAANTFHQVRLRGVNSEGPSEWSDPATFTTRPDRPESPALPSPSDREEDRLRLNWSIVNGIHTYDFWVNGAILSSTVRPPFLLEELPGGSSLGPNLRFAVAVRARDDSIGGVSEWSAEAVFVTRPPRPGPPRRAPFDLVVFGIVLHWAVSDDYSSGGRSFIRLFRTMDGVTTKLLDGENIAGGLRSHRFVDSRQTMSSIKTYRLQAIVPASATPAPIPEDGGENRSFASEPLTARLPLFIQAFRSRHWMSPSRVGRPNLRSEWMGSL
ncbi:fibronectin type III domain-containing protein [Singulisphaera sp. Ch08]|uniref:Fibronectin type III domain-containing protein n=1 Tax=Singulisphaera sp. Ch08 TaxID=3120278 RepID=A0AAU7C9W3_9BACT